MVSIIHRSVTLYASQLGEKHAKLADTYSHIELGKIEEALTNLNKALETYKKSTVTDSISIARTFNFIGIAYDKMKKANLALKYYEKTLNVQLDSLPTDHSDIALTYNNIGSVYHECNNPSKALEYYEQFLDISRTEDNIKKIQQKKRN